LNPYVGNHLPDKIYVVHRLSGKTQSKANVCKNSHYRVEAAQSFWGILLCEGLALNGTPNNTPPAGMAVTETPCAHPTE